MVGAIADTFKPTLLNDNVLAIEFSNSDQVRFYNAQLDRLYPEKVVIRDGEDPPPPSKGWPKNPCVILEASTVEETLTVMVEDENAKIHHLETGLQIPRALLAEAFLRAKTQKNQLIKDHEDSLRMIADELSKTFGADFDIPGWE